jgi:hypothetical protein
VNLDNDCPDSPKFKAIKLPLSSSKVKPNKSRNNEFKRIDPAPVVSKEINVNNDLINFGE